MNRIAVSGGLGNQLFQWAAIHAAIGDSTFSLDLHHYSKLPERKFELAKLYDNCKHLSVKSISTRSYPITRVYESLHFNRVPIKLLQLFGFISDENYREILLGNSISRETIVQSVFLTGLFQDTSLVTRAYAMIEKELNTVIDTTYESCVAKFDLPERYAIVHVRRSDYPISAEPSHAIGQLSDDYFINLLRENELPLILVSENSSDVTSLIQTLKPTLSISKIESTSWETLAMLSNANLLIGSNSTLSWWGAYLSLARTPNIWLPKTWSQWGNYENLNLLINSVNYEESIWKIKPC